MICEQSRLFTYIHMKIRNRFFHSRNICWWFKPQRDSWRAPIRRHWNIIKPISPKFFYTHELQKQSAVDIQQIRSSDNLANLFTKAMSTSTFKKLVHKIRMCCLRDVTCWKWSLSYQGEYIFQGEILFVHFTLFP